MVGTSPPGKGRDSNKSAAVIIEPSETLKTPEHRNKWEGEKQKPGQKSGCPSTAKTWGIRPDKCTGRDKKKDAISGSSSPTERSASP